MTTPEPQAELDAVARRIVEFLDDALEQRVPERDVPRSREIAEQLVAVLPEEDPGWSEGIERVAAVVASALANRAEQWAEAFKLIAIYLQDAKVDPAGTHPRIDRRILTAGKHVISLGLAVPVALALLREASPSERVTLWEHLDDDWDLLETIAEILPSIPLTEDELITLLVGFEAFTRDHDARIHEWAGRHPDVARQVVQRWLEGESGASRLDHSAIAMLVEGVVAKSSSELKWRDELISRLTKTPREQAWRLAASLACFAWPKDHVPPVEQRHAALLEHVKTLPERLLITGLWAMRRDAGEYPVQAIETALELLEIQPDIEPSDGQRLDLALAFASVVSRGLFFMKEEQEFEQAELDWQVILDALLIVPPDRARDVDSVLRRLVAHQPDMVEAFFARWVESRAATILREVDDIEESLPLLTSKLDTAGLSRWLVRLVVHRSVKVRQVAVILLIRRDQSRSISASEELAALTDTEARVFVHALIGSAAPGRLWIPLLVQLGHSRVQLMDWLLPILLDDAVSTYPGACRDALRVWQPSREHVHPAPLEVALDEAYDRVSAALDAADREHRVKLDVPEILTIQPSWTLWREAMQREMRQMDEKLRKSGRFPFWSMVARVPIARGESSVHLRDDQPQPFATHSISVEYPLRDAIDPIASELARGAHRQRAAELIESVSEAEPEDP